MEVLLATAILLGSVLVLMELAGIGRHYIQSIEDRTTAQLLCQSKLNEMLSGVTRLEEVQQRTFEDHPDWEYTVEILPVRDLEVSTLRVTVTQQARNEANEVTRGKPKRFTLYRWIPNSSLDRVRR